MGKRILIINGHPDADARALCTALCDAYSEGANKAGHDIRRLDLGLLDFPLIRSMAQYDNESTPPDIVAAQKAIGWADHLVVVLPLWHGGPPALLKGFFEQAFRHGSSIRRFGQSGPKGLLAGRSARLIVTMGMPARLHKLISGVFGIRSLRKAILEPSGVRPVRTSFLGGVCADGHDQRGGRLHQVRRLGSAAI